MSRDGLAEVLTALTGLWTPPYGGLVWSMYDALQVTAQGVSATSTTSGIVVPYGLALWTVESPAHGVEKLAEVGIWPWAPGDPSAPRWWCEFLNDAEIDDPPSLAALVAVASRGAPTLRRVAELVAQLRASTSRRVECRECRGWGGYTITTGDGSHGTLEQESCEGCGGTGKVTAHEVGATLVFRVMSSSALKEHHERRRANTCVGRGEWLCATFSTCVLNDQWTEGEDLYGTDHRPLHALADCGVHLVVADRERVVLAVEALDGGGR